MAARILLCALVLSSCAVTKQARLYDMAGGKVLPAQFEWRGATGEVTVTLPSSGERCIGEYSTLQGGAIWGRIYEGNKVQGEVTSGRGRGSAVVVCPGGFSIECEYVSSGHVSGTGYCNDNRGGRYRLMF